jgi:predicted transcriptional regulator
VRAEIDLDAVETRLDAGESLEAIAESLGVTSRTIRNHLRAADRQTARQHQRSEKRGRLEDANWLREKHVAEGLSASVIAELCAATTAETAAALSQNGISRPPRNAALTEESLRAAFAVGGSVKAIAHAAGVDPSTVRRAMRRHGITNPRATMRRRPAVLDDADWLRYRYLGQRQTMAALAAEAGCDPETVRRALVRNDIPIRVSPTPGLDIDPERLAERWADPSLTVDNIANEAGCAVDTVRRAARRIGLPRRSHRRGGHRTDRPGGIDPAWLERRFVAEHRTLSEIAHEAGTSVHTVHRAIRRHGLDRTTRRQTPAALDDHGWLRIRYVDEKATIEDIAGPLGTTPKEVRSALRRFGIRKSEK